MRLYAQLEEDAVELAGGGGTAVISADLRSCDMRVACVCVCVRACSSVTAMCSMLNIPGWCVGSCCEIIG